MSNLETPAVSGGVHYTGMTTDEDVDCVRLAFIRSPKKLISQESAELQMLQGLSTEFFRRACLKPYKLQVIQKLAACHKQIRSQFVAHVPINWNTILS
jgi:hypothetical protein